MKTFLPFLICVLANTALAQTTVLHQANVVDVINGKVITNQDVLIENGIIISIEPSKERTGGHVIDVAGKYLIPGLFDSHTHIEHSGYGRNYNPPRENLVELLAHALLGGITGIREMACDVRVMAELSRSAKLDLISSPDIYYPSLLAGPAFFKDPRSQAIALGATGGEVSWAQAINEGAEYSQIIAAAKGNGSHALKLYALLAPDQVSKIKTEADRQGLAVWSHAYLQQTKPSELIDLQLQCLSHAPLLLFETSSKPDFSQYPTDDQFLLTLYGQMSESNVALDPTLFVYNTPGRVDKYLTTSQKIVDQAHKHGVMIVAGTDSISAYRDQPLPFIHDEIASYVSNCNLSPTDALQTATINAATMLGINQSVGSITNGKKANIVVLNGNPLEDILQTRNIEFVMKNGQIIQRK